jgi:hypothetical protein
LQHFQIKLLFWKASSNLNCSVMLRLEHCENVGVFDFVVCKILHVSYLFFLETASFLVEENLMYHLLCCCFRYLKASSIMMAGF